MTNTPYQRWRDAVDRELKRAAGLSSDDLMAGNRDFVPLFEDGLLPAEAAAEMIQFYGPGSTRWQNFTSR